MLPSLHEPSPREFASPEIAAFWAARAKAAARQAESDAVEKEWSRMGPALTSSQGPVTLQSSAEPPGPAPQVSTEILQAKAGAAWAVHAAATQALQGAPAAVRHLFHICDLCC